SRKPSKENTMKRFHAVTIALIVGWGLGASAFAEPEFRLLWPDGAPGAKGEGKRDKPGLYLYPAPKEKANGTAVIVFPGGGYGMLAIGHEGHAWGTWYNELGITAFVCRYRHSPYRHPTPLGDAQRAIRTVRSQAESFGIDPGKIGIQGFSAGGHLVTTAATKFDQGKPEAKDPIERVGCRPDFLIACYPVVSFTTEYVHAGSRRNLLGENPDPDLVKSLSNELQVTKETPPTFLFHTNEDRPVPPENSMLFYQALRKAGVPAELHIFQPGRHGVGLAQGHPVLKHWPDRLKDWLRTNKWL
ncbi:MAG: alpha/beta hydrolase, partial [Verrucomicrobiota bacterium]